MSGREKREMQRDNARQLEIDLAHAEIARCSLRLTEGRTTLAFGTGALTVCIANMFAAVYKYAERAVAAVQAKLIAAEADANAQRELCDRRAEIIATIAGNAHAEAEAHKETRRALDASRELALKRGTTIRELEQKIASGYQPTRDFALRAAVNASREAAETARGYADRLHAVTLERDTLAGLLSQTLALVGPGAVVDPTLAAYVPVGDATPRDHAAPDVEPYPGASAELAHAEGAAEYPDTGEPGEPGELEEMGCACGTFAGGAVTDEHPDLRADLAAARSRPAGGGIALAAMVACMTPEDQQRAVDVVNGDADVPTESGPFRTLIP